MRTTFTIWPPLAFLSVLLALAPGTSLCHAHLPAKAAAGALDARQVRMKVPGKLLTDQVFLAKITMENTGSQAWGDGVGFWSANAGDKRGKPDQVGYAHTYLHSR